MHVELANDYLDLRGLDAQTGLLLTTVEAYQRALDLTKVLHTGGASSGVDVDRAAAQLSSAKAQVSDVAAQRALYEHCDRQPRRPPSLNLRYPACSRPVVDPGYSRWPPLDFSSTPAGHCCRRTPFLRCQPGNWSRARSFLSRYHTERLKEDSKILAKQPSNCAEQLLDARARSSPLTLFDGGRRRALLAASKAGFELASADYRATVLSAFQQVEDQLALSSRCRVEAERGSLCAGEHKSVADTVPRRRYQLS